MSKRLPTGVLCASVLLIAAPLSAAPPPAIDLTVPNLAPPVPSGTTVITDDLIFSTGGTTAPLAGYDLFLQISGPTANLTIIGADIPANAVISDGTNFTFTPYGSGSSTIYGISNYLSSGTSTITDGSVLVQLRLQALAGTTGTYNVNWVSTSPYTTKLYTDTSLDPVPGEAFAGGVITFSPVPEPTSLGLLGAGALVLVSRRKRAGS